MASFNRVILVGNLTRDVELKYLQSGTAVTELGLAVNDRHKSATGEWVEETVFVDISLFGRTAEIASEYLQKGSSVLIEGRLKYDKWEKEGKKYSKLRVVGERMQMLGPRGAGNNAGGGAKPERRSPAMPQAEAPEFTPSPSSDFGAGYGGATRGSGETPAGAEADIPF